MRTPLVLLNLWHQPVRTVVAILGVAFAVLLIFMQLGFLGAAELSATRLYGALDFDLLVRSRDYRCLTSPRSFPRYRLQQVLGHAEVVRATPVYIDWQLWRNPDPEGIKYEGDEKGRPYRRAILVLAFNINDPVFRRSLAHGQPPDSENLRKLSMPNTVFVDTYTRKYFGKHIQQGTKTELNGVGVTVEGKFTIGAGLGADGLVVMSDQTHARLAGVEAQERPMLGLIKLKEEGRATAIREELRRSLYSGGEEVEILTRAEVENKEWNYWLERTPVVIIFTMGTLVACLVGVIFVYQVIATDIADHSAEYATLRAIGYSSRYLSGVVLRQAAVLAMLGYVPAWLAAIVLYDLGRRYEQILLFLSWKRAAVVLLVSITMCSVSGLLAIHKVKAADPADQF
jgi:putative ABC transport system permease protein